MKHIKVLAIMIKMRERKNCTCSQILSSTIKIVEYFILHPLIACQK